MIQSPSMIENRDPARYYSSSAGRVARRVPSVESLEIALAFGADLVSHVNTLAIQFAVYPVEVDLPEEVATSEDAAVLQTAATLYLASELESARLLPAVETLAGLAVSGGLDGDLGQSAERLYRFFQQREARFNAAERGAFFARLFGNPGAARLALAQPHNQVFESLMIELTDALYNYAVDQNVRGRGADVVLRLAARRLAENLLPMSGGLAGYAAEDIIRWSNEALNILKDPSIQRVIGARSVWTAIDQAAERYLGETIDVVSHVERGRAGVIILAWLAERYTYLSDASAALLVSDDDPVIFAAAEWLQASLNLEEQSSNAHMRSPQDAG